MLVHETFGVNEGSIVKKNMNVVICEYLYAKFS